jgi:hypothetical protein
MLQPNLRIDKAFDMNFRVKICCSYGARVELDVRFDEVATKVAPAAAVQKLQKLLRNCVVRSITLDDRFHDLPINWCAYLSVIVQVASKQGLHQIKIANFAVDCSLKTFDTDDTIS